MIGRPKLTDEPVRCINCGEQYRDCDVTLHHAGRTVEGDFWNSECPCCGKYGSMNDRYAQMSDEEFREEQHHVARLRWRTMKEQQQRKDEQRW